jgi:hypothetical protein
MQNETLRKSIKEDKSLPLMSVEELHFLTTPIGRSIYLSKNEPEKKSRAWSDKIKCGICGAEYYYSNSSVHKKTQRHKIYDDLNKKLAKLMLLK